MRQSRLISVFILSVGLTLQLPAFAQITEEEFRQRSRAFSDRLETNLKEPFKGITTDGELETGLFPIYSTGIDTSAIVAAASDFIATLSPEQQQASLYPVDDVEWRKWGNQHIYFREGVSFEDMDTRQRAAAFTLLEQTLSPKGFRLARDIMHLNETLGEMNGDNFIEYGEWKYWITIMGSPSATEPWGWQMDGHHLILNFFVLGDQVVMTPAFWGSEPITATSGKYAGTSILQEEQEAGRQMMLALNEQQQQLASLEVEKTGNNILTQAFSDNVIVDYSGINAAVLDAGQKAQLLRLIGLYVGNMRGEHAVVRMADVAAHLDNTWFAWVGDTAEDAVYYYRIQSPVILIEFDHEVPVGLTHINTPGVVNRDHIHIMVRTPNGNDYGKDLLRQHRLEQPH